MKRKIGLVLGIFGLGVGIFMVVSGIIWASAFYIGWGVVIVGIGVWNLLAYRQKKVGTDG